MTALSFIASEPERLGRLAILPFGTGRDTIRLPPVAAGSVRASPEELYFSIFWMRRSISRTESR